MMLDYFDRLFTYDYWGNRRALGALRDSDAPPERAVRLFCHILAARQVWMARLTGTYSAHLAIWPTFTLDECADLLEESRRTYRDYLRALELDRLEERIAYHNSKGMAFENSIAEILTHVAMHGTYHRGQIAQLLAMEDDTPPVTDFIQFLRTPE